MVQSNLGGDGYRDLLNDPTNHRSSGALPRHKGLFMGSFSKGGFL
jgi:hypothetical protein